MIVAVGRIKWIPDSEFAGMDNVAWILFDRPSAWGMTRFVGRAPPVDGRRQAIARAAE
jgi:hypothetical protein